LIEPTGVHGRTKQVRLSVSLPKSSYRCLTAVGGAVVHDPEIPTRRSIWLTPHHLIDQTAERIDSSIVLTSTQDSTTANFPSGKILQGASSLVFMFHSHSTSWSCRQSCMTSDAGLNARILIRADGVVPATERFALPRASVQVQGTFGFVGELRFARHDTVLLSPGFNCIHVEDSPDSARTDRSAQVRKSSVRQVSSRKQAQRQLGLTDGLTGNRLDDCTDARGKRRACVRGPLDRLGRSFHAPNVGASGGRNSSGGPPRPRPQRSISPAIHRAREPTERSACGTVRLRTRLRHLSRNSSGNAGRSTGAGPGMVRLHSQEAIGFPAERIKNRPSRLSRQPHR
jgi:hypothetical protein